MPTVMIVDDDEFIRYYLKKLFEEIGYTVVAECENGEKLFDTFMETKPDILMLDIHMPGINGDEILIENKDFFSDTLVIILTMNITEELKEKLENEGYTHFLRKNIEAQELTRTIKRFWIKYCEKEND